MRIPVRRAVALLAELGVGVLLPWLIFHRFASGLGADRALLLATVPPLVWAAAGLVLARRIDALALLALSGIGLSLLGTALGGSPVLLVLRENLASVVIGLVFLGSLAIDRPLVLLLARALERRRSPEAEAALQFRRHAPGFRHTMWLMTLVWGSGLLGGAALAGAAALAMAPGPALAVGPLIGYGSIGLLSGWTAWYRARQRPRGAVADPA